MASRLMLSLKKAAVRPKEVWSLETMTNLSGERSAAIRFASQVPGGLRETPPIFVVPSGEDVELGPMPRLPGIVGNYK